MTPSVNDHDVMTLPMKNSDVLTWTLNDVLTLLTPNDVLPLN